MNTTSTFITLDLADGTQMRAYTAKPENAGGKLPALIIFQEAFGVNTHIRDIANRFAAEGYLTIAPELYHRTAAAGFEAAYTDFPTAAPHMMAMTHDGMVTDVHAVQQWLKANSNVDGDNISCIGYCMGGRMSFLANTIIPLRAAVSYYGGRIAPDLIKEVSSLHAPMLFFWGGLDHHIPKSEVTTVIDAMNAAGKDFVSVEISYADHGFFCDVRASYNAQAAKEAWPLTLAFLNSRTGK